MGRVAFSVSPGARRTELVGRHGDGWKVRVAAAPERGRANAELAAWLAAILGLPRADVRIVAGATTRRKTLEVDGLSSAEIDATLAEVAERP